MIGTGNLILLNSFFLRIVYFIVLIKFKLSFFLAGNVKILKIKNNGIKKDSMVLEERIAR